MWLYSRKHIFQWYDSSELWADSAASDYDLPHLYFDSDNPNVEFPGNADNEMVYEAVYDSDMGNDLQFTASMADPPGTEFHRFKVQNLK